METRERIAVVGAGLMGHGIAQVFAAAGHEVAITDEVPEALASVHERVRANLYRAGGDVEAADLIVLCATLEEAVAGAELVIEAASEDLELKRALFARLGRAAPKAILATNTSVISIGEIAAHTDDPGRTVGTHFWNPPYLIPLVEVTQAEMTRLEIVQKTMGILARAGKTPIHVRHDVPGFVGNRLQHALWREAIALVDAGICDAESVNTVVKQSFGLRLPVLGPLENADLVGLDLALSIHDYLLPHLDATAASSPLLRRLVEEGNLGMRTGQGFRQWSPEEAQETRERLFDYLVDVTAQTPRSDENKDVNAVQVAE